MKTIKLAPGERLVTNQLNRKGVLPQNIVDAARDIVANVRANGDAAVRDYCQRFDGVELQSFRLPQEQVDAALEGLDPAFVAALEKAGSRPSSAASICSCGRRKLCSSTPSKRWQ